MKNIILLIFLQLEIKICFGIVGGRESAVPPLDDPVVFVNYAGRFARVEGYLDKRTSLYTFRGLKYAEPPIRENRFLRPRYKRLIGDVDAKRYGPPCPQPDFYDENKIIGDEDCLILNIFTPKMPDETTGLPVYLFIHGGGYRYGSANQYEAYPIIQNNVVFVPIQYRLGTLGILGDGTKEFGGNVALFDMNAALRWVTEYISFFGGDPKQIKVMGHGSGASAAMFMSQSYSQMGRSNLNGVIAMSGSSLSQYAYDEEPVQTVQEIAKINECPFHNDTAIVKCMREKPFEDIIKKDSNIQIERLSGKNVIKAMTGMVSFGPSLEKENDRRSLPGFLVEKPEVAIKKEQDFKIPLLIGVTEHETANGLDVKEINKIFTSGTEFLKNVSSALNLKNFFGKNSPENVAKSISSGLGLPKLTDYLTIPNTMDPEKMLQKFVEVTTDVFFNIPTFLTADLWGKFANSFLYQFTHKGDKSGGGKLFLKPLPIVSKNSSSEKTKASHGDELGYLFNPCDVFGNRINGSEIKSDRDKKARKNFIDLIVKFAYFNGSQEFKFSDKIISAFSSNKSPFINIGESIGIQEDFRFCQMSLWGAQAKSAQKMSCEFLSEGIGNLNEAVQSVPGTVGKVFGGNLKKVGF